MNNPFDRLLKIVAESHPLQRIKEEDEKRNGFYFRRAKCAKINRDQKPLIGRQSLWIDHFYGITIDDNSRANDVKYRVTYCRKSGVSYEKIHIFHFTSTAKNKCSHIHIHNTANQMVKVHMNVHICAIVSTDGKISLWILYTTKQLNQFAYFVWVCVWCANCAQYAIASMHWLCIFCVCINGVKDERQAN